MGYSDKAPGQMVDWVRHYGTERIAIPSTEKRPYIYQSPVLREDLSKLLDYEPCKELGISSTLFRKSRIPLYYVECVAKQACWFVKHLCERTDMVKQQLPFRFGITTDMQDIATPYLEACNFPVHLIDWIESKEAMYPSSTKMIHMKHDSFKDIERVIHLDVMYHFDTHPTQNVSPWFDRMKKLWMSHSMALPLPMLMLRSEGEREFLIMDHWDEYWGEDVPSGSHILWNTLSDYTGEPASKLRDHFLNGEYTHEIPASFFGFSRRCLDEMDLDRDIYPIMRVSTDECAFVAYTYRQGWGNDDVADLGPTFKWKEPTFPTIPHTYNCVRYSDIETDPDHWMEQYG